MGEKNCPCETVRELEKKVEYQKEQLNKGSIEFATINAKLNMLMAILGCIGAAVVGLVIKMLFFCVKYDLIIMMLL